MRAKVGYRRRIDRVTGLRGIRWGAGIGQTARRQGLPGAVRGELARSSGGGRCSCSGRGMLKQQAVPQPDEGQNGERPRKKLSFREPEIMGYYLQMKQNVANRLSRKGRIPKKKQDDQPQLVDKYDSSDDPELQVRHIRIDNVVRSSRMWIGPCTWANVSASTKIWISRCTG